MESLLGYGRVILIVGMYSGCCVHSTEIIEKSSWSFTWSVYVRYVKCI